MASGPSGPYQGNGGLIEQLDKFEKYLLDAEPILPDATSHVSGDLVRRIILASIPAPAFAPLRFVRASFGPRLCQLP